MTGDLAAAADGCHIFSGCGYPAPGLDDFYFQKLFSIGGWNVTKPELLAVLCVIISMTLQVPELATSAYMVFFVSKESKLLTTITGVGGVIVLTIGIGATLLLYKFTYGHPELRIPGMAIALFLGMWLSRVLVIGPLGFLLGFVIAVGPPRDFWIDDGFYRWQGLR